MSILISTIYKGSAVIQAIKLYNPTKIYFIVDEPIDNIRKHSIEMIRDFFPNIPIEQYHAKIYDIVDIANKTMQIIEKESKEKIIIHISEGRKTMSFGVLFGAYSLKEKVTSVHYIVEETNQPINIPLLNMNVSSKKREILRTIADGKNSIPDLEKELEITSATLYVHLKDLRDEGYLTKENKLTEMGKIVLLKGR